jgi:dTDP-4-dehydrorhamnose 3,5-epimerase
MISGFAQDPPSVTPAGESLQPLPVGITFHEVITQIDDRGTVCELFDTRWNWHKDPLVFVYAFTLRPGMIKGWGMHQKHEDRYFVLFGEMEVVLYDDRPDIPTCGLVSKVVLSEYRRQLMNIPAGIWHANHNIGQKDVVVINFPTLPYDHANPDKYRLPLDTDKIPYKFENLRGW